MYGAYYTNYGRASVVKYHEVLSGKDYFMVSGLLNSKIEGEYLVPKYGRIIFSGDEVCDPLRFNKDKVYGIVS